MLHDKKPVALRKIGSTTGRASHLLDKQTLIPGRYNDPVSMEYTCGWVALHVVFSDEFWFVWGCKIKDLQKTTMTMR